MHRSARHVAQFALLLCLLLSGLPATRTSAQASPPADDAPPALLTIPPVLPAPDVHLPALALDIAIAPDPLVVGDTAALTLTVTNGAPDAAEDLVVTLPTPDGASALPGPNTLGAAQGWLWNLGHLDGASSLTLNATLRLESMPAGAALLLRPQASARGLSLPTSTTGGALVLPADRRPATITFTPGTATRLRSPDGRVAVDFPARAFPRRLTLSAASPPTDALAPTAVGRKRSRGVIALDATDDVGLAVHQFAQPLTLTFSYTPEQLAALRIDEADLTIVWFDAALDRWTPLPTTVNMAAQTASALVDHFTQFSLADGSSPSSTFIPSLQGWQVSGFTGAASYSYPFELPGSFKPHLSLSYSSSATDNSGALAQSSWVGAGWSLETGKIALNKQSGAGSDYYSLVLDGQSYDIVRGERLPGTVYSVNHILGWDWHATDEAFLRVRAITDDSWAVWTRDGVRYDFSTTARWGWNGSPPTFETYAWYLTSVTDPHGNRISYSYNRLQDVHTGGTADVDVWPSTITWGANIATGAIDRYQAEFVSAPRRSDGSNSVAGSEDMEWDYSTAQYSGQLAAPHQTRKLTALKVWSKPAGSWQLVRQYNFGYDFSLYSDAYVCVTGPCSDTGGIFGADAAYRKLTLRSVTRVGSDGVSALPLTSLSYGTTRGTSKRAAGGWNRLVGVDNGQGGTLALSYANIAQVYYDRVPQPAWYNLFFDRNRVTSKTLSDGQGHSELTSYSYGEAAMNSLGTLNGGQGPNAQPNSAALVYWDKAGRPLDTLAVRNQREFRGHSAMTEKSYDGPTTAAPLLGWVEHSFYQGDVGCTPAAAATTDSCFTALRDREFVKGREYLTVWKSAAGVRLKEVAHTFASAFYPNTLAELSGGNPVWPEYARNGLWRAFRYESRTEARTYDPSNASAAPAVQATTAAYDVTENSNSNGGVYGNLSREELFDDAGVRQRITMHFYAIQDVATPPASGSPYIVDHPWADYTWDGSFQTLAYTAYFYDNGSTQASIGASGNLTRQSAFYDLPSATNPTGVLHSRDVTYSYDSYGNQLTEVTYVGAGTAQLTSSWVFSAPGSGSTARTTTTTYDATFHAFATQASNPLSQSTRADYDYRMGTLLRVTGPNTSGTPTACGASNSYSIPATEESSCGQYDLFGRLVKLVKPGDSTGFPTVQATYFDTEQPFRYRIDRRETAGTATVRSEQQFYDGLGRKIQVKAESANGTQNIVTDTRYDALDRVKATSQPRYVSETASSFIQYTNPGTGALYRETTTTYDGLGRALDVQGPDLAIPPTKMRYSLGSLGVIVATTDSNSHKTERETDEFGRLRAVREYTGTSTYSLYATTSYLYSALDQLTRVTDAGSPAGNVTTMSYNSLGRKTSTDDSDMGLWSYTYDANGNLVTQTDAKGQVLWFGYDALDRLTQKRQSNSAGAVLASYTYDQTSATNKGIGQRTAMSVPGGASASWTYDARGRTTQATHTIPGLSGTRVFGWAYDSGDRLTTLTYPIVGSSTETVTMTYDAAWRPLSACSSLSTCYVQNAVYTALDQPDRWTLGNNLIQKWSYSSPLQRLSQLQVGATIPPPSGPASIFDRSYSYDNAGNVDTLIDNRGAQTQNFDYDHLDRLTHAWTSGSANAAYDETYSYSTIGNLTNKDGVAYSYPASGASSVRPHTPTSVGGTSYVYDANGNLTSGAGRSYTWAFDNLPASVSQTSGSESYSYDGDGERVKIVRGSTTTVYLEGLWEEVAGGAAKAYYTVNGQTVAVRDRSTNVVTYLHGDHLGSVSVATTSGGAIASQQEYTPFGSHRGSGDITQTSLDYTGQRLDGTGLLYYHARMYDPALGRFVSADSIVPGAASGAGGGAATLGLDSSSQLTPLTVDFHEPGFVATVNGETAFRQEKGFWFQLSDEDKQKAKSPWGPANPQALNRYSYVLNNPVRYVDPSGHLGVTYRSYGTTYHLTHDEATVLLNALGSFASTIAGIVVGALASGKRIWDVLAPTLVSWGLDLGTALIIQSYLAEIATMGVTIGEITLALGVLAVVLAAADALYGYQGLDITFLNGAPGMPIVGPPTPERQLGTWRGDTKTCNDFLCLSPV